MMTVIQEVLKVNFVDDQALSDSYFQDASLVMTIPMPGLRVNDSYCADNDLRPRDHEGVYTCDPPFCHAPRSKSFTNTGCPCTEVITNVIVATNHQTKR